MSLINKDGTRKKIHVLTGDHDQDYFLTQEDMSEDHWNMLMSCHHQGRCDDDCEEAVKYFHIENEIRAVNYLIECGIERERFLIDGIEYPERVTSVDQIRDREAVEKYYLWILSGDIQERSDDE